MQEVKVKRSDLGHIVSTGAGRKSAPYITGDVLEVVAYCRAMVNRIFELLFRLGIERKNIL